MAIFGTDPFQILDYIAGKGPWVSLVIFLYLVIFHYEEVGVFLSRLYKLFAWTGTYVQKKYVAQDIASRINLIVKKLSRETTDLMPHQLKIVWVKPDEIERDSFIESGVVVMKMAFYANQDKNFVHVVHDFVTKQHLTEAKAYLNPDLIKGIDLALVRKYLNDSGKRSALNHFVTHILRPGLEQGSVNELYGKLEQVDELGIFTRILLTEYLRLAKELYPQQVGSPGMLEETERFLDYLHQFPTKQSGVDVKDLNFAGQYMRISIVLVARPWKIQQTGYGPYVNAVENALTSDADVVYITALGNLRGDVKNISMRCKKLGFTVFPAQYYECTYHREKRKAICVRVQRAD